MYTRYIMLRRFMHDRKLPGVIPGTTKLPRLGASSPRKMDQQSQYLREVSDYFSSKILSGQSANPEKIEKQPNHNCQPSRPKK